MHFITLTRLHSSSYAVVIPATRCRNEKTLIKQWNDVAFRGLEVYYLRVIENYMTSMGVSRDQLLKLGHPDLKKMKNFGGNMKRFSLLFILVFAVAAFGQEAMEAPAEDMMVADSAVVDTMAMDEMLMTDTTAVEEAVVEEDAGDALEAMLAEEGTMETEVMSGSALIGYTIGLDFGYPLYMHGGLGESYDTAGPAFGLVVNSPFGAAIGPFEIGFGAQVGMYSFTNSGSDAELSGIFALATANTALLETSQGAVSAQIGAGYFGASLGLTAGVAFDYAVAGMPLVIRPYVRMNATLDSGAEVSASDEDAAYTWLNGGIMLSYDISTLF
jgi:hypothetical protein